MNLENDQQLANTQRKLAQLEEWIAEARCRTASPEDAESLSSLVKMANQLREEIIRYRSRQTRRAS